MNESSNSPDVEETWYSTDEEIPMHVCPVCRGRGLDRWEEDECPACYGEGEVEGVAGFGPTW